MRAYRTVLGHVIYGFRHVHFSEHRGGAYLNPLRPGGRVLSPWRDIEPPVIGPAHVYRDGRAIVSAFDPQSFVTRQYYETPVLAPAALAWRLYGAGGRRPSGLHFAIRSSQHVVPDSLRFTVFAPGARNPGFTCFYRRVLCIPRWRYWLAGGLAPRLPLGGLPPGRYRLAVYAWDYADNRAERDTWFDVGRGAHAAAAAPDAPSGRARPEPDVE